MAYEFIKLNETTVAENADDASLLIERDGNLERISPDKVQTQLVQPDWNETDTTSPAFILNKPEVSSGPTVITYGTGSNTFLLNDVHISPADIYAEWEKGNILRFKLYGSTRNILDMNYVEASGSTYVNCYYIYNDAVNVFEAY